MSDMLKKIKTDFDISNPDAIIFDKDGTLLSFSRFWEPVSEAAVASVLNKYSAPKALLESVMYDGGFKSGFVDIRGALCCGTYEDIAELIANKMGEAGIEAPIADIIADTKSAFDENLSKGEIAPTCDGLNSVLMALRTPGTKLFVVTTDRISSTMLALRELGIEGLFDEIITTDTHPAKPDPAAINYLVEKYGFNRRRMMMVGDTLTDVEFAHNAGICAVALADNSESAALLSKEADAVIPDILHILDDILERTQDTAP